MKKAAFLAVFLCSAGIYAMLPQGRQKLWEASQAKAKARRDTINALLQRAAYDSVILYCVDTANRVSYDMRELALSVAWWHKGDKSKAYQYVLNHADYEQKLSGGGGNPFGMICDYSFGDALAADTFLEKMLIGKVTDYYRSLDYYPDRYSGIRLMLLAYRQQKLSAKYEYDLRQCPAPACKEQLEAGYRQDDQDLTDELLNMLAEHGKLYSRSDAGPAAEAQFHMIFDFKRPEDHAQTLPMFYRAMMSKEIEPDVYVDAVVAADKLKENNEERQNRLQDSLCRIYHCSRISADSLRKLRLSPQTFIMPNGDTIFYRNTDIGPKD